MLTGLSSNKVTQGALLILLGETLLAVMAAIIKHLSADLPSEVIVFFRNIFGLFMLVPILMHSGLATLKTNKLHLHILRASVGLAAMYGFFYVLAHMPLAEAQVVKLTSPFFMPLIAAIWLGEFIKPRTGWTIAIGFIGVLFILRPGTDSFSPIALVGIAAAFMASLAKVTIRHMGNTESSVRIVFYFGLITSILSSIPLLWSWKTPSTHHWPWILLLGFIATLGQLCLTRAYRIANPGKIGPYVYSSVLYGAALGWFFWGEILVMTTIVGSLLIIGAGILNLKGKS